MKNRNDDKKYILSQYRKKEIKRLFNKLEEIQNKPCKAKFNQHIVKRMFGQPDSSGKLAHIPKNQNEQKLYQIRKENQRLVERLAQTKMTVVSHQVSGASTRRSKQFKSRENLRLKEIQNQNKRLFRAIKRVSSEVGLSLTSRKFSRLT